MTDSRSDLEEELKKWSEELRTSMTDRQHGSGHVPFMFADRIADRLDALIASAPSTPSDELREALEDIDVMARVRHNDPRRELARIAETARTALSQRRESDG